MRMLLLSLFLGSSVARAAEGLDPMCTWTGAKWDQGGNLRVPGTDVAWGYAHGHDGVSLDGTLGIDPWGRVRFRVDLRGTDLVVAGEFDPYEDSVFAIDDVDVALGLSAVLVHGALFAIAGRGPDGTVMVGPHRWASEAVWSVGAIGAVRCEEITVHWRPAPEDPTMLAAVGFPADAPEKMLSKGRSAKLYAAPNGAWIGAIQKAKYARLVRVAEERDGYTHVAVPHWTGTVWHGWVRANRLQEPVYGEGGAGILGALSGGGDAIPVRRCAADTPLRARVGRAEYEVGTVKAGTPFQVKAEGGGSWEVAFPGAWLQATDDSTLLVAADHAACTEGTLEPATWEGLGTGLLGP